ncbi:hypothetical protein KIN20_021520 [Parelaphostrongylus tenuis]|uniref:Uncharacterized protein n=1 Tax=Parelaphostrongylus tenuis TaxID=148309 RepID=A0AAD5N759_PARTN|nr:hypothetical protein KIN20_021520 [Parelaphostrongylus tenuis]
MKIVGGYSLKRREQCVSLEHEETNGTLTYMEQRQLADDLELVSDDDLSLIMDMILAHVGLTLLASYYMKSKPHK